MPENLPWGDMSPDGPSRPSGSADPPVSNRDVELALEAVTAAHSALQAVLVTEDQAGYAARLQVLHDMNARYVAISAAAEANAAAEAAAAAAVAATPVPADPASYWEDRATDAVTKAAVAKVTYEVDLKFKELTARLDQVAGGVPASATVEPSGKTPRNPPRYNSLKGAGRLTVDAWLLQFVDWCTLYAVPMHQRVSYAIQALEGDAVQNWYNLKRVMIAEGKDPDVWDAFRAGMIAGYAEVSPDIYVRTTLSKLKQGTGSVQTNHE